MASALKQANKELRAGNFANALGMYRRLLETQPIPRALIQFNLEYAERRAKQNGIDISATLRDDETSGWVTHKILQLDTRRPRIVIGGMVLGYPDEKTNHIADHVIEYVHLYQDVAQLEDVHGLRLLFNEESVTPSRTKRSTPFTVHAFNNQDICLGSIWYSTSRDLRVSIDKDASFKNPRVLRAYQHEPVVGGGLVLVGECFLEGESWQLTDLALANPYLPVLLTLSGPDGVLTDAALIPYPSLLPGGIHEHECYVGNAAPDPAAFAQELLQEHLLAIKHGWALGKLQVDIREAIGTETILSNDIKEWMWNIFSLRIKPWRSPDFSQSLAEYWQEVFDSPQLMLAEEKFSTNAAREREGRALLCPARSIPSLRALTASRVEGELEQTCGLSEFLLVQEGQPTRRWKLSWPEIALNTERALEQDGAVHVPIVLVGKNTVSQQNSSPPAGVSAILRGEISAANGLQLIMPIAPDLADSTPQPTVVPVVDVIVTAADLSAEIFSAFLESLSLQQHINIGQIVVIPPSSRHQKAFNTHLQHYYAGRNLLLPARKGDHYKQRVLRATAALKHHSDDAYMLFVNQPLVLHNPRTLAKLAQILATPKAVTTSALLIGNLVKKSKSEIVVQSGGIFPVRSQGSKVFEWRQEPLATAIPRTTLPVASHGDALFMIKAKEWEKSGGLANIETQDESAVHEYSAKLAASKKLHLLVPHVTVELHDVAEALKASETGWRPPANLNGHLNAVCIEVLPS